MCVRDINMCVGVYAFFTLLTHQASTTNIPISSDIPVASLVRDLLDRKKSEEHLQKAPN